MDDYESLSHTKWDCKYHVVFIPKYRRKTLYVELRRHLGEVFRKLALQKESRIEEGHLMSDHVHMMISIPPKYAVSQVGGFIKGKSAIHLARVLTVRSWSCLCPVPEPAPAYRRFSPTGYRSTSMRAAPPLRNIIVGTHPWKRIEGAIACSHRPWGQ